jgi:16S rRNA (adenine1518-N6/adenine1519-N6)-dimethyltransferase
MMLEALPPLREVLSGAGLSADKRFGQHFLLDLNLCRKVAKLAQLSPGDTVLEVGPGPGGLTRALLELGVKVVAVERDPRFAGILNDLARAADGLLTLVEADALEVDEVSLVGQGASVVANLPYNVGTPLLVKWLTGSFRPRAMTLMFQREVAQRIVAPPGGGDFGRLAVLAQCLCEVETVMDVPARAFTPPPKVNSAVVRLLPRPERPDDALVGALIEVGRAAFGQRRKMLRSSIRNLGGHSLCAAAGVNPDARAETVPVAGFVGLAKAYLEREG